MAKSTVWRVLAGVSLFCLTSAAGDLQIKGLQLKEADWIGLGFWVAPKALRRSGSYYQDCFTGPDHLYQASSDRYSARLGRLESLKKDRARLSFENVPDLYCRRSPSTGVFEELVFYKDLSAARKLYADLHVWARQPYAFTMRRDLKVRRVRIPRFDGLKVLGVELAPPDSQTSLRVRLGTSDGREVFYPIGLSRINRRPKEPGLGRWCFLKPPWEVLNFSREDFQSALAGGVREGMSRDLLELMEGPPEEVSGGPERETLTYIRNGRYVRYVLHANRVMTINRLAPDEF